MQNVDYHFEGEREIPSPALVYHEDVIDKNIEKTLAIAGGPERMWPHVKTHKNAAVIRMLEARGIKRFKCATIAEAEMCAMCGAEHILVAYPLVGPAIDRFVALNLRYTGSTFWAAGDDLEQLALLGAAAGRAGLTIPLLVDVNCGMNRTGVPLEEAVLKEFCLAAARISGLKLEGFHCYDGNLGLKDPCEREAAVGAVTETLFSVRAAVEAAGQKLPVLVMGGTPTFPFHARNRAVFLSPGTLFIQDHGYDAKYKDLAFTPGAALLTRVISRPGKDLFTLDLGYKAISADQGGERGIIAGLPDAVPESHSEEHWVFRMRAGECPAVGSILYVIPTHICSTTVLYPGVYVVRNGHLVNYWKTSARDRKISL
ncbi:MAG: D-TA family PLP-dependent enzyme [Spirochaetaceae bacterium]|jgi:D-serine deaminase-like pyridoxal phosphate-dependent protein|nr:D-TA family PLP-dependent enzyme [Spirochaetaceae bacterium]